jgi:hypothetical protein
MLDSSNIESTALCDFILESKVRSFIFVIWFIFSPIVLILCSKGISISVLNALVVLKRFIDCEVPDWSLPVGWLVSRISEICIGSLEIELPLVLCA